MYTLDEIKEFIEVLEDSSLSVLEVQKDDGSKIHLEKAQAAQQIVSAVPAVSAAAEPAKAEPVSETDSAKTINAPIVGVFYAASAPGKAAYVSVGKKVKRGDIVCIIEAMKCMNEIQSEEDGEIAEILVKDGDLVEYGQPLFKIK